MTDAETHARTAELLRQLAAARYTAGYRASALACLAAAAAYARRAALEEDTRCPR